MDSTPKRRTSFEVDLNVPMQTSQETAENSEVDCTLNNILTTPEAPSTQANKRFKVTSPGQCHNTDDYDVDAFLNIIINSYRSQSNSPKRKRPSMTKQNSCSSSDVSSSLESEAPIYLDLRKRTALVCFEPLDGTAADNDAELKTRVQKLLGLVAATRRLYNPMDVYTFNESPPKEPISYSKFMEGRRGPSKSPLRAMSADKDMIKSTAQRASPSSTATSSSYQKWLRNPLGITVNDMQKKELNDMVQRINATCITRKTPEHIKEPIDLSALPSDAKRATICLTHKSILLCLEQHPRFYSFIESLNTEIPIEMCHPIALTYRQYEFGACKKLLAITLFNIFNHAIFQCGLQQMIEWKRGMKKVSSCFNNIESGGQRVSKIILSDNIKHIGVLVKAILHEMCHAAAFVYHGETGHGDCCRKWAYQANVIMPEAPIICDCEPTFKYVCCLCQARSYGNTKFEEEATKLRCAYCQFELAIDSYSGDNVRNLIFTHHETSAYKEFIKEHYMTAPQETYSVKMKWLNNLFLASNQTE